MSWNCRVIRYEDFDGPVYALHECQFDKNGDTIPTSWNEDTVKVCAETRVGLFWVLAVLTEAVAKPVLEIQDDKLVEVEPERQLTDDLKKAIMENKKFSEGMA